MNVNDFEVFKEKTDCTNIDFQAFSREEEFKCSFWGVINEINELINFYHNDEGLLNTSLEESIFYSSLFASEENIQDESFLLERKVLKEKEEMSFYDRFALMSFGDRS
ncbi:hypothetical protein MSP8887_00504 [Marinomonas spartinae]|uniref:hypothetical protein n=1 Tax=Marinomonas spartinae TaxID=1792290 RepID=UPI000808AC0A|nr:hypothetical protein [Marinomonas spartinae]SBS26812.1 hypothetical protein MSP8887_00504 [Marinomonas spartinae]